MIARTKILLIGGAGAAIALGLAVASTSKAKAAPLPPPNIPTGDMPWMVYSEATKSHQEEYNEWAAINGFPSITADGILGPASCRAFTNWLQNGGPDVPPACANLANEQTCRDAQLLRVEYFTLEGRINSGESFSGDEEHLQDLYNEIARLERLCGDYVLTGSGTRQ